MEIALENTVRHLVTAQGPEHAGDGIQKALDRTADMGEVALIGRIGDALKHHLHSIVEHAQLGHRAFY